MSTASQPVTALEADGLAALVQYNGSRTATARRLHVVAEGGSFGSATPPYITDAPGGQSDMAAPRPAETGSDETAVEQQAGP